MSNRAQTKTPYVVTVIGVVLVAISEIYSAVRTLMFRAMFRPGGFSGTGGAGPGFGGPRQFGGVFGFGLTNYLAILGIIIAIVGVVWLGLALRKPSASR